MPKQIFKSMRQIMLRFIWNENLEKKGKSLISSESTSMPNEQGVLGIKNIQIFSTTLAMKGSYKMFTRKRLWQEILHLKYISLRNITNSMRSPYKNQKRG